MLQKYLAHWFDSSVAEIQVKFYDEKVTVWSQGPLTEIDWPGKSAKVIKFR